MCLSTVITSSNGSEQQVMSDVSNLEVAEGVVTFTDLLGAKVEIKGTVKRVDFLDNKIFVEV